MDISVHLNGSFETYKNVDIPLLHPVLRWFHMCLVLNRTAQRRMFKRRLYNMSRKEKSPRIKKNQKKNMMKNMKKANLFRSICVRHCARQLVRPPPRKKKKKKMRKPNR